MDRAPTVHSGLDVLVEEIADLRPLPALAAHVLQIAEGEHFSAHELAQAISSDPALTARILRVANSAYYNFPRRITTVRDAVVLLGFRQVRSTALAACVMNALPASETIEAHPFWRHSVLVAMVAEMLARSEQTHQDEAFTAGVLHNIGRLALDQARPADLAESRRLARRRGLTLHEAQRELFGFTDAEVGGALALQWQFPPALALAIASHGKSACSLSASDGLARIVSIARRLVAAQGVTDGCDDTSTPARSSCREDGSDALPPLVALGGGFSALMSRASAFVEHTAAAP